MRNLFFLLFLASLTPAWAQSTATLAGRVLDSDGHAIRGAALRLENPVTGFDRRATSSDSGAFSFSNIPFHTYRLIVERDGFKTWSEQVSLRANVPVELSISLEIGAMTTSVTVEGGAAALVDPEETGSHSQMNQGEIDRMAAGLGGRGIEAILVTFPGFAQNANGAIHPRGAHNQMTYVIDGMPVSDQMTGAFANAVDADLAQTVELFTGNISAEFGGKVAAVANITTRSGLGTGRRAGGNLQLETGRFDMHRGLLQVAGERGAFGYSLSLSNLQTHRYLDQVSLDNLHNGGNAQRAFLRLDWQKGPRDIFRFTAMTGRSSFQLANLRSQHLAGQDQRQLLRDLSASLGWVRTLGPKSTLDATLSYRTTESQLKGSPGDTPVTATQDRRLSTLNAGARYSRMMGRHTLRAGADYQTFPVRESFSFALTAPAFNPPGTPDYNPNLAPYDLSRGGSLFRFSGEDRGRLSSLFLQDTLAWGPWRLALGLRYDDYGFLVHERQLQPRLGAAYHLQATRTVFRASYNRTLQTPPNENLLLSSAPSAARLAPPAVQSALGVQPVRIRAERQNLYEAGLQQALGSKISLDLAYFHKDGWDQQDNNNFLNTGVVFPIALKQIRVNGAEAKLVTLPVHGISGSLSVTHSRAISTPPFTGGLYLGNDAVAALSSGPFVIDHDQPLALNAVVQYQHKRGLWLMLNSRYDRGLVANPSDPAEVAADPDYRDLLPYVNLTSDVARVRPRTITGLVGGYTWKNQDGKPRWELRANLNNLTNRTALYSFQSVFVGTRVVAPRSAGVALRWYW